MVDLTKPIGKCTAQELAAAILLNAGPGRFNPHARSGARQWKLETYELIQSGLHH